MIGEIDQPCPFCNSNSLDIAASGYCVICDDCGCEGPFTHNGEQAAVELWNRRPDGLAWDEHLETDHGDEED